MADRMVDEYFNPPEWIKVPELKEPSTLDRGVSVATSLSSRIPRPLTVVWRMMYAISKNCLARLPIPGHMRKVATLFTTAWLHYLFGAYFTYLRHRQRLFPYQGFASYIYRYSVVALSAFDVPVVFASVANIMPSFIQSIDTYSNVELSGLRGFLNDSTQSLPIGSLSFDSRLNEISRIVESSYDSTKLIDARRAYDKAERELLKAISDKERDDVESLMDNVKHAEGIYSMLYDKSLMKQFDMLRNDVKRLESTIKKHSERTGLNRAISSWRGYDGITSVLENHMGNIKSCVMFGEMGKPHWGYHKYPKVDIGASYISCAISEVKTFNPTGITLTFITLMMMFSLFRSISRCVKSKCTRKPVPDTHDVIDDVDMFYNDPDAFQMPPRDNPFREMADTVQREMDDDVLESWKQEDISVDDELDRMFSELTTG